MPAPAPNAKQPAELNELVAAIAADVLRRLGPVPASPASEPLQVVATSVAEEHGPLLTDKVVALAAVSKLPSDLTVVTVRHDAVLTPSAREWLRDHKVRVHRATAAATTSGAAATAPAFLVAACDLPSRPAGQAAALVRAVPNGQHLPSAGLTAIVDAFAEGASRSGSRGMLLSSRPAAAALIANRKRAVRAVAASSVAEALAVALECRATLLVVDPRRFSTGGLQRLAIEFAKQKQGELPADLAEASRPCGCSRSSKEVTA